MFLPVFPSQNLSISSGALRDVITDILADFHDVFVFTDNPGWVQKPDVNTLTLFWPYRAVLSRVIANGYHKVPTPTGKFVDVSWMRSPVTIPVSRSAGGTCG